MTEGIMFRNEGIVVLIEGIVLRAEGIFHLSGTPYDRSGAYFISPPRFALSVYTLIP